MRCACVPCVIWQCSNALCIVYADGNIARSFVRKDVWTCFSWLQTQMNCYAAVIQETCNKSAADINMLKTVVYDARLRNVVRTTCVNCECYYLYYSCNTVKTWHNYVNLCNKSCHFNRSVMTKPIKRRKQQKFTCRISLVNFLVIITMSWSADIVMLTGNNHYMQQYNKYAISCWLLWDTIRHARANATSFHAGPRTGFGQASVIDFGNLEVTSAPWVDNIAYPY